MSTLRKVKNIGHSFYLVDNSPWPILSSLALYILTNGFVMYFHQSDFSLAFIGFLATICVMVYWFRDMIQESTHEGHYTYFVRKNLYTGVALFIISEVMFFVSLFWAYLHSALAPHTFIGNVWPPAGVVPTIWKLTDLYVVYPVGNELFPMEFVGRLNVRDESFHLIEFSLIKFWNKLITDEIFFVCSLFDYKVPTSMLYPNDIAPENMYFDFINIKAVAPFYDNFKLIHNRELPFYVEKAFSSFNWAHFPLANTFLLITSGVYVTLSLDYLKNGYNKYSFYVLAYSLIFAFLFTFVQYVEYRHLIFGMNDSVFGSAFYLTTGFHGIHVIVGSIWLIVCLVRLYYGHFTKKIHVGFETGAWYWHFVDVVWIFVFFIIYVWSQPAFLLPGDRWL